MTTTELIKILKDNEYGGISHKPRELSLTINGKYMPNPQITLSSTGDGIAGPEIDFDVDGEWFEHEADGTDDVLDKIRAEIAEFEEEVFHRTEDYSDYAAVRYCLEIIDKYKAESEDKE